MNWREYYINIAEEVKRKSKDEKTKIGVVLVGEDGEIVSTGYNSFPRGINDNVPERQERPEKYYWFAHAELNCIVNAARIGVSTKNTTMYMTCSCPCADCARAIINAGVKNIVCAEDCMGGRWIEHKKRSMIMFEESGVVVTTYKK